MPEIEDILNERGSRYGDFGLQAQTAQNIRDAFESSPNWAILPPYMKEALSLMTTKFSRMLTGDVMYMDNVVDLIGYMTLMKTEMEKHHARVKANEEFISRREEIFRQAATQNMGGIGATGPDAFDVSVNPNPLNWNGPYHHR